MSTRIVESRIVLVTKGMNNDAIEIHQPLGLIPPLIVGRASCPAAAFAQPASKAATAKSTKTIAYPIGRSVGEL